MYKIKDEAGNAEILFYDQIGFGGQTTQQVVNYLNSHPAENITLRISSVGGDLGEAIGIYNYLKSIDAIKTVYIDGLAYSAASVIAMAGDRIIMPETAMMLIHNPWTYCEGNADDMRETAEQLDKWRDICARIYMKKTGLSYDEIVSLMNAGKEMNGLVAKEKGFVDEVSGSVKDSVKDAYEAGVKAERERLRALDELMTAERAPAIMKAKYETYAKADEIALALLKQEKPLAQRLEHLRLDLFDVTGISMNAPKRDEIEAGAKILNSMRGY